MGASARSGVPSGTPLLRVLLLAAVLVALWAPSAHGVAAVGGSIHVSQNCNGWNATVELNHQVAPVRTVDVVSTIPGHPGIEDGTFDTSFGQIWMASGAEHNLAGTVTLVISRGEVPLFTASSTLVPAEGCTEDTTTTTTSTTTTTQPAPPTTEPTLPVQGRQDPTPPDTNVSTPDSYAATGSETVISLLIGLTAFGWGLAALQWSRRAR